MGVRLEVSPGRARAGVALVLALTALAFAAAATPAAAGVAQTRYSLVGGCYGLRSSALGRFVSKTADGHYSATGGGVGAAEPFRMQASGLGRYLLYGAHGDYLTIDASGGISSSATPDDWRVDGGAGAFTIASPATNQVLTAAPGSGALRLGDPATAGAAAHFSFEPAGGCAQFPEIGLNASGAPARGASPEGEVSGFLDAHMHWAAFEFIGGDFHCGSPFNPFGVTYALPDCASSEGPNGSSAPVQNFLNFGEPVHPHDTRGWPNFKDWPQHETLTFEQTYYRWVQRAWLAGERMMVVPLVANRALCDLFQPKHNPCDEMDTVRLELHDMHALQDYVDAQSGGPGKGWLQIVRDPFEARRVANEGKLAVVLGIETSELFGCSGTGEAPHCDGAQIDRGLDEFQHGGVRSLFLVNKFDNALAGVRFDSGPVGALINAGNKMSSGSFWSARTCTGAEHDNTIFSGGQADAAIAGLGLGSQLPGGVPTYPDPPHCNTRGLTTLGEHLIRRMMQRHMILEIDHLSVAAGDKALSLLEQARYSGVISAHSWIDPLTYPKIYALGGMVTPYAGSSLGFASAWRAARQGASRRYYFGFGYGSDMNGLGAQGPPRQGAGGAAAVSYPFKSFDGRVTFDRQRSGNRVFDINTDGVAQYGLYPDWIQDLRNVAGDRIATDLFRGSEAYLQMWERADGVPAAGCRSQRDRFTDRGLGSVRLGYSPEPLLRAAGQPARRIGRVYSYCVDGRRNARARVLAVFTPRVTVGLVASTARRPPGTGIGAGDRARLLRGRAAPFVRGVQVGKLTRRGRLVYGVRGGRVRWVAVATRPVGRSRGQLRSYLRLARLIT